VEDVNLRLEFHRALDAVTPPAPWLGPRLHEEMQRRRRESFVERARRRPGEFAWLLPAIAVLLAIAVIVTITLSHVKLPQIVPVRPNLGGAVTCPTWGFIPVTNGVAPASMRMMSTTVGWAPGDLRTTDGGQDWHDVSPRDLRAGEPFLPGQQTVYPPSYTDYFLDADHAWLLRSYDSPAACLDHYGVFRTSDGGRTWRRSTIATHITAGLDPTPALDFLDAQRGWLVLTVGSAVRRGTSPAPSLSLVYRTTDGGQSWRLISSAGPSCASIAFISATKGFSACGGQFNGGSSGLLSTKDGGVTWSRESVLGSSQESVAQPVFFDSVHGATVVYQSDGYSIDVTSDGGATWRQTASAASGSTFVPSGFQPYNVNPSFEDAQDFWLFATPPGCDSVCAKGGVVTDWLYHSADGGATWQLVQRNTPISYPTSISFTDPLHCFALQTDQNFAPEILVTSDGGHTWRVLKVQIS